MNLDFAGTILNAYSYAGAFGIPRSTLILPSDSIFLLTARTPPTGRSTQTNLLSKHGPNGEVQWARHFYETNSSAEINFRYMQRENDQLIFTGHISGHTGAVGGTDLIIMNSDTFGNFRQSRYHQDVKFAGTKCFP